MPVGTQALAIDPRLCDGVGSLLLAKTKHLADNGGAGNLDQHNVVQTDLVERVEESQAALNFVGLDHGLENVTHGERLAAGEVTASLVGASNPVGNGQNGTEVVARVPPFGGQPAVIVVEPPDHGTDVEGAIDGVELERGTGDLGAIGHNGALDDGPEQFSTFFEPQALKTAAERVEEDPSRRVKLEAERIVSRLFAEIAWVLGQQADSQRGPS